MPKPQRQAQPPGSNLLERPGAPLSRQAQNVKSARHPRPVELVSQAAQHLPANGTQVVRTNFLLAEALFESGVYGEAAVEYERMACDYPWHDKAAGGRVCRAAEPRQMPAKDADPLTLSRLQPRYRDEAPCVSPGTFPGNEALAPGHDRCCRATVCPEDGDQAGRVADEIIDLKPPAAEATTAWPGPSLAHAPRMSAKPICWPNRLARALDGVGFAAGRGLQRSGRRPVWHRCCRLAADRRGRGLNLGMLRGASKGVRGCLSATVRANAQFGARRPTSGIKRLGQRAAFAGGAFPPALPQACPAKPM